jgi:O-methyltransferase
MKKIKDTLKKIVAKTGYTIARTDVRMDFVSWAKDAEFEDAASKVRPYTLLLRDRLFMLWQFAKQSNVFQGATAQVGVFRGGSARLIAYATKGSKKPFFLFDTFEGMPKVDQSVDLHEEGDFKDTSIEAVKKLFNDVPNIQFCKGRFPGTSGPANNERFGFVYIDVDIYQSTKDSLDFFYPKMIPGGFMMFDDYMGKRTPGVKKTLDEFLADKKEKPIITTVGQCVLIKQ